MPLRSFLNPQQTAVSPPPKGTLFHFKALPLLFNGILAGENDFQNPTGPLWMEILL